MKTFKNEICTKLKMRTKKGHPVIYWRERDGSGTKLQEKYWGKVPTARLEKLLLLINEPSRGNRIRMSQMVGLQINDLPETHLKNTKFLKDEFIEKLRLKEKEKLAAVFDKRKKSNRKKQRAHPEETLLDFIGGVIRTAANAVDVQKKVPLEQWPKFQMSQFIREIRPLADLAAKAEKFLT